VTVSAFDLRQEPSAVVPHGWDLYGGCRVTGIPTVTAVDFFRQSKKSNISFITCSGKLFGNLPKNDRKFLMQRSYPENWIT
jgi:hypothetical protein